MEDILNFKVNPLLIWINCCRRLQVFLSTLGQLLRPSSFLYLFLKIKNAFLSWINLFSTKKHTISCKFSLLHYSLHSSCMLHTGIAKGTSRCWHTSRWGTHYIKLTVNWGLYVCKLGILCVMKACFHLSVKANKQSYWNWLKHQIKSGSLMLPVFIQTSITPQKKTELRFLK